MNATNDQKQKDGHDRLLNPGPVHVRRLDDLQPAQVNDRLYKPIDGTDPDLRALAALIGKQGLLEPIVITQDDVIVSGHRRRAASQLAGLSAVPVRIIPIVSTDVRFVELLASFNSQRVKTLAEQTREAVVLSDPTAAYQKLIAYRRQVATVDFQIGQLDVGIKRQRKTISAAKRPFLDSIIAVVNKLKPYWPLTDRQIHYQLLNDPPLRHSGKPTSRYANDLNNYKDVCDMLTRARLAGEISWGAVSDATRPITLWRCHANPSPFIRKELDELFCGYSRDLLQSQPIHIEVVAEKMTVQSIVERVTRDYCIPTTIGRGYSSIRPRFDLARRFQRSGKERLVVLFVSDFDPEGESIAESFARSLRDDFGIANITPVKVALTADQVMTLGLPPVMKAKAGSSRRKGFVDRNGEHVFELEALAPERLQGFLRAAIEGVLDLALFHAEVDRERQDAVGLDGLRQRARMALAEEIAG